MKSSLVLKLFAVVIPAVLAVIFVWQRAPGPVLSISKSVARIDLAAKGLTSLPAEIGEYTNAIELILDNNSLTGALPAEIRKMSKLQILSARNNQLTGIPAEIGQLRNLKVIDFANNKISTYPNELLQLQQQLTLILTGNPITTEQVAKIKAGMPNAVVEF